MLDIVNGTPIYDLPKIWGPRFWGELHTRACSQEGKNDAQWLRQFANRIPCTDCRKHWNDAVNTHPPVWMDYFQWTVSIHNFINRALNKPKVPLETARHIWISGPQIGVASEAP